jgi:tetratricopeptide (TPR) repeat protein
MLYLLDKYNFNLFKFLIIFFNIFIFSQSSVATGIYTLHHSLQPDINPELSKAYAAYQRGDEQTAQRAYKKVLETDKNNRDALLGLAALALRRSDSYQAIAYYRKILRLYPQDTIAQVNLINILGSYQNESQLKLLLLEAPHSAYIYFSLGNFYARQRRWAEAQHAFLKALNSNELEADYAYNLAVSYEHLKKLRLALNYYKQTLKLAKKQTKSVINFNIQAVQRRVHSLESVIRK